MVDVDVDTLVAVVTEPDSVIAVTRTTTSDSIGVIHKESNANATTIDENTFD